MRKQITTLIAEWRVADLEAQAAETLLMQAFEDYLSKGGSAVAPAL